jgi:hypothetical protein
MSKITGRIVSEMRVAIDEGLSISRAARKYHITWEEVKDIADGATFVNVTPRRCKRMMDGRGRPRGKYPDLCHCDDATKREIGSLYRVGFSLRELGKNFGVSHQTIANYIAEV